MAHSLAVITAGPDVVEGVDPGDRERVMALFIDGLRFIVPDAVFSTLGGCAYVRMAGSEDDLAALDDFFRRHPEHGDVGPDTSRR